MAGLDPAIHGTRPGLGRHNEGMDHRVKPGDDDLKRVEYHQVTNIAATAPAIAPVDSHPMAQSGHQWHRHDAIDDGRPEQCLDRIEVDEVDHDANQRGGRDRAVEGLCIGSPRRLATAASRR
jgi:hypothetical protein